MSITLADVRYYPQPIVALVGGPARRVTPEAHEDCHHVDTRRARLDCREAKAADTSPLLYAMWAAEDALRCASFAGVDFDELRRLNAAVAEAKAAFRAECDAPWVALRASVTASPWRTTHPRDEHVLNRHGDRKTNRAAYRMAHQAPAPDPFA